MAPANGHSSSCGLPPAAGFGLACRRASAAGDGLHRRAAWARRSSTRLAWTSKAPRRLAPTAGFGAVDVSSASEAVFGGLSSSLRCFLPTEEAEKNELSSSSCRRSLSVVLASRPQIWAKEAACATRGAYVCVDRHGTRCVCHTRPRSQKIRSRFFEIQVFCQDFCAPTKRCCT